ncbi:MAG: phenylalanine--tRNA ligase subunit alpha [Anaerolineales bacterium]|nr:phenylalanine--tRNA ligase subunit alpha [Anaerolineales bacterium]
MLERLEQLKAKAFAELENLHTEQELQAWKVNYLGRTTELNEIMKAMRGLSKEERPLVGKHANEVKQALERAYDERHVLIHNQEIRRALENNRIDVTLPGRSVPAGRLHPVTQTLREIYRIFGEMGFQVYRSRDVELDEINFQALNIPPYHPARDMQDTFYVDDGRGLESDTILLRTHTSPGQVRAMRELSDTYVDELPSLRIILPGMCYRYEQISARSEIQFTQVEGLAVGKDIRFSDLKGTLSDFARRMFGQNVKTRFRADHFPFTEPSAEMDVECFLCGGVGCPVCKRSGWLEILGCGMVHPAVLKNGGYDPEIYTGFAFGMGPERITMMRHRIGDIRYFWANDLRFLEQF